MDAAVKGVDAASLGIIEGDFREAGTCVADNSVQLIFTDPPYSRADVGLYTDLAAFASRVLMPGGLCLAYAGKCFLPDIFAGMSQHLEYVWTSAIRHTGALSRFRKCHAYEAWKAVLWFAKPPFSPWWEWSTDLIDGGGKEKDLHPWQQAEDEAAHFIELLSSPGGLVCDPFCGSGTTCIAAKNLGRKFIAFEIDAETVKTATARLLENRKAKAS